MEPLLEQGPPEEQIALVEAVKRGPPAEKNLVRVDFQDTYTVAPTHLYWT